MMPTFKSILRQRKFWLFQRLCVTITPWLSFLILADAGFSQQNYGDLDLEDLLKIEIVELVTKKAEPLMDSSLSVSVLHSSDIQRSGAQSIPEALRLIPGVLVREQSNGAYDVNIMGLDDISTNKLLPFPSSSTILVMIDYRVVYNYFSGGTFWETLPVGLLDIERIELIRGPFSALYGPNAVTGVVNIVTRQGSGTTAPPYRYRADFKSKSDYLAEARFHHVFANGLQSSLSFNGNHRKRFESGYWDWVQNQKIPYDRLTTTLSQPDIDNLDDEKYHLDNINSRYPDPETSLKKFGANLNFHYPITSRDFVSLTSSVQTSFVQRVGVNNFATPLTTNLSMTRSSDLRLKLGESSLQAATIIGEQEVGGMPEWKYKLNVNDLVVNHQFHLGTTSLRPEISGRQAIYNGEFIGGKRELNTLAFSVFSERNFLQDTLRLLLAGRLDSYSSPKGLYPSYQLSLRYRLNIKNILYTSLARANRAPFMVDNFLKYTIEAPNSTIKYIGNQELNLMTIDSVNIGYRYKMSGSLSSDVNIYNSRIYQLSDLSYVESDVIDNKPVVTWQYRNTDDRQTQVGSSFSVLYEWTNTLKINPYLAWQKTTRFKNSKDLDTNQKISTPSLFGGMSANYRPLERLNLSLNSYFMSKQSMPNYNQTMYQDLGNYLLTNARLAYSFETLELFFSARNLGTNREQYAFADTVKPFFLIGISSDKLN